MTTSQEQFQAVKRQNAPFFFPESAVWSDGVTRRFKVTDPNRAGIPSALGLSTQPIPASLRLLKVHPDDARPAPGASCQRPDGLLVLGMWTDEGQLSGGRTGVCRLVDGRAYPIPATAGGTPFLIRIVALSSDALATVSGNDLAGVGQGSHRALLPPGITLQPTDVITTGAGDQYRVIPPVQRDVLGDTLGLSWLGTATGRTPTPGTDPTPEPQTPVNPPEVDPWWEQTS
ncbi:hypothetical protein [Deinococcus yunweiensis]|uniref:hypothetical protein n=1 Tax=Deinococcus yunweiensis TaxID=367282 RepID=UPI00398F685B